MDAADLLAWGKAFAFTELVEAPIYRALVPTTTARALAASAITHPFVWFFFPWAGDLAGASYVVTSAVSELFAWGVEAAFFRRADRITWGRAVAASFVANAASLGLGLLVRATLGIV